VYGEEPVTARTPTRQLPVAAASVDTDLGRAVEVFQATSVPDGL
jgi:hypothetical protein